MEKARLSGCPCFYLTLFPTYIFPPAWCPPFAPFGGRPGRRGPARARVPAFVAACRARALLRVTRTWRDLVTRLPCVIP